MAWRAVCKRVGMAAMIRKGTKVNWSWGKGTATGKIAERFTSEVTRTIDGTKVKRKATPDEPAYLVEQRDGSRVLKSRSELERA